MILSYNGVVQVTREQLLAPSTFTLCVASSSWRAHSVADESIHLLSQFFSDP